jgi:hypothetical protein
MALGLLVDVDLGLPAVGLGWNAVAPLALAAWAGTAVCALFKVKHCWLRLGGDRALAGRAYGVGVFVEDASFVAWGGGDEGGEAGGYFFVGDV